MSCQWEKALSKERSEKTLDSRQKSRGMPGLDPWWQNRGEDGTSWIQEKRKLEELYNTEGPVSYLLAAVSSGR